jgi:hypothetical protein
VEPFWNNINVFTQVQKHACSAKSRDLTNSGQHEQNSKRLDDIQSVPNTNFWNLKFQDL